MSTPFEPPRPDAERPLLRPTGPALAVFGARLLLFGQIGVPTFNVAVDLLAGRDPIATGSLGENSALTTVTSFVGGALIATRSRTVPAVFAALVVLGGALLPRWGGAGTGLVALHAAWLLVSVALWDVLRGARSVGRYPAAVAIALDATALAGMLLVVGAPGVDRIVLMHALSWVAGLVHLPRLAAVGYVAVRRAA